MFSEYRAAQLDRPIRAKSASIVPGQMTLVQAVGRNSDGTLRSVQQRTLTIATKDGERMLIFPRGWGPKQLREAASLAGFSAVRSFKRTLLHPKRLQSL
jgi:hypothetical protein